MRDFEQDFLVEDYVRETLGSGKGVLQFAQRFIEMRRKLKNGANGNTQASGSSNKKKKESGLKFSYSRIYSNIVSNNYAGLLQEYDFSGKILKAFRAFSYSFVCWNYL